MSKHGHGERHGHCDEHLIDFTEREERNLLEKILHELKEIARLLRQKGDKAKSAALKFIDSKGKPLMPATLQVGQTATAVLHEFTGLNGTGSEIAPIGPVSFTSSDPTIATVDAATGLVTAVGPGVATVTGLDGGNGLSASDVVSDTPVAAQSATLTITVNP